MIKEIILLTFFTAFITLLPKYFFPPSLNSTASLEPVDAPEGIDDLPINPFDEIASTSMVGLPLESNICLA